MKQKRCLSVLMAIVMLFSMFLTSPISSATDNKQYTFTDNDGYTGTNNFGRWIKFNGDFSELGTFGDGWIRPAWVAGYGVHMYDALTLTTGEGCEVIKIVAGQLDGWNGHSAFGVAPLSMPGTYDSLDYIVMEEYAAAVTYIFPYPIVSWKLTPLSGNTMQGKVFLTEGPVDYTTRLPDDYSPQADFNTNWSDVTVSGTVEDGGKYYYLTVLLSKKGLNIRSWLKSVEVVLDVSDEAGEPCDVCGQYPCVCVPQDPKLFGTVAEAGEAPLSVDAHWKENVYGNSIEIKVDQKLNDGPAEPGKGGSVWMAWKDNYLYVFGAFNHDNFEDAVKDLEPNPEAPWEGTNVELYIDAGNKGGYLQYRIAAIGYQTVEIAGVILWDEDSEEYFESASRHENGVFYVEYKIDLDSLYKADLKGFNAVQTDPKFGVNVHYQETDGGPYGNTYCNNFVATNPMKQNFKYVILEGYTPPAPCSCTEACPVCGGCAEEECCQSIDCDCELCPNGGNCTPPCTCVICPLCGLCMDEGCCQSDDCACPPGKCQHVTAHNRFTPTDELLINPHMGFTTQQRFNGDFSNRQNPRWWGMWGGSDWDHLFIDSWDGNLSNSYGDAYYPDTSVAYIRIYWADFEPRKGEYRWDIFDRMLELAKERRQTLMFRIMPFGSDEPDVPAWYREEVGPEPQYTGSENAEIWWRTDENNPLYVEYFSKMVAEIGRRYDGHPYLDSVDLSFDGYWGEMAGTEYLTDENLYKLIDAYLDNFKKTPMQVLLTDDDRLHEYIRAKADGNLIVGFRADGFGDQNPGWNHMYSYYPHRIAAVDSMGDGPVWHHGPVSWEAWNTMQYWVDRGWDVDYNIAKSLEWHVTTFNNKSVPIPAGYEEKVNEWIKKMGYRFAITDVRYTDELSQGDTLYINSTWSNLGVAPLYHDGYPLAFRLKNQNGEYVFHSVADINQWLPGSGIQVFDTFKLPDDITVGEHELQVAILGRYNPDCPKGWYNNPAFKNPAIKLANEFRDQEGWYTIGTVNIRENSDMEVLQNLEADLKNVKKGFDDLGYVRLVISGKTLKLVFDDREIVLSTNANNKNQKGEVYLGNGYWLVFDIKGNGSNVKEFRIIKK